MHVHVSDGKLTEAGSAKFFVKSDGDTTIEKQGQLKNRKQLLPNMWPIIKRENSPHMKTIIKPLIAYAFVIFIVLFHYIIEENLNPL